jgi:hypothetical protein
MGSKVPFGNNIKDTVLVYIKFTDVRDVILLILLLYNAAVVETKLGEVRRGEFLPTPHNVIERIVCLIHRVPSFGLKYG